MILGIGIDIVHISRMQLWQDKPPLLERYFHGSELKDAEARGDGAMHSLAARFAAKEAYGKALGTGLRDMRLVDIRVENDAAGKPLIRLFGSALRHFNDIGGKGLYVSLTHESDNAIAVVVIEGE